MPENYVTTEAKPAREVQPHSTTPEQSLQEIGVSGALKRRLASGAALEVLSAAAALCLRLGSSLILTRLLFPAAFGLSSMVVTVITGLVMISDVGIAPAVLRSPRGEDPAFLRTAYSLQVLRASVLAGIACLLGWPMAHFMREPEMIWLMPCGGLVLLIHGFCSTRTLALRRELRLAPLVTLDLGSQLGGTLMMIAAAHAGLGVLSLVVGAWGTALISTLGSFLLPGTQRDGFAWEPTARREIVHFGRWILASSALTFASGRGDQFALARLFGATSLGYYNVALAISEAAETVATRVANSVIYPLFAQLHNRDPNVLRRAYYRARLPFDALTQTGLGVLYALAPWLIELLYDERYQAAIPMLKALVARAAIGSWATACEVSLTAQGLSAISFRRNLAVTIGIAVLMPVGFLIAGPVGLLWGTACARLLSLTVLWPAAHERGLLRLARELWVLCCFALGLGLGSLLDWLLPR